jgi:hypothetical protein
MGIAQMQDQQMFVMRFESVPRRTAGGRETQHHQDSEHLLFHDFVLDKNKTQA